MNEFLDRLLRRSIRRENKREIEEELQFHVDLLTEEHLQHDYSLAEAKEAARRRFGDVQLIAGQCLDIRRRRSSFIAVVQSGLVGVFVVGVLLCIYAPERTVTRVGDLLMTVAALCRLLLYVRGLNPSRCLSEHQKSPLMLNQTSAQPFTMYDDQKLTPVERVISEK
jgi:hypothetical protein